MPKRRKQPEQHAADDDEALLGFSYEEIQVDKEAASTYESNGDICRLLFDAEPSLGVDFPHWEDDDPTTHYWGFTCGCGYKHATEGDDTQAKCRKSLMAHLLSGAGPAREISDHAII